MPNASQPAMELYVSPEGNDAWSGRLPEPNAERTDGPLKSIVGARDRLRVLNGRRLTKYGTPVTAAVPGPVTVWVRGGSYPTFAPILFGPEDSFPVTYAAYPGETPIIEGGVRVTGWQETQVNGRRAWVADLPDVAAGKWEFRELFVNGRRAMRPRRPKQGLFRMEQVPGLTVPSGWGDGGYTQFVAAEGDVQPFRNLDDVEIVYVHFWIGERSPLAGYDPATRTVTMVRPSRAPLVGSHGSQLADYYLDNVFEALTDPGEWYLDRAEGRLYYLPLDGEDPQATEVWAPKALQLLALIGQPEQGRYVEFLRFEGLTFRHTDWRYPSADGASIVGCSDGKHESPSRRHARGNRASAGQGESDVPGVITLEGSRFCAVEDCTLEHLGWYGVEIGDACHGIRLVGNTIADLGAGGVMINGADATAPSVRRTGSHRITDNEVRAGGRIFHAGIGVLSMHADRVVIAHNHIHDFYYSGVSVGWVWGYAESVSRDNLVEKNHIHHLGQGLLSDMGGIYTLGVQPGTKLRGNLIHDIEKAHYGAWCIYPDEGTSHVIIENNVCYDTNDHIFHQHYGRENVVRNNIFAFAPQIAVLSVADPDFQSVSFYRNVFISDGRPMYVPGYRCALSTRPFDSDVNLFWDLQGAPRFQNRRSDPEGEWLDLEAVRALGLERNSVVADPKVKDLAGRDFALAEDSPAAQIGFRPIDLSDVGPRPRSSRE